MEPTNPISGTIHQQFLNIALERIKLDKNVIGLAVGGSYFTNEFDEYSDLDLVLVTHWQIAPHRNKMINYARNLGNYVNGFTGEHVGEPRVLICLYDDPLIHVDIKFLTQEEFKIRVEDPAIVWDPTQTLTDIVNTTKSAWPPMDFQWIEDRFWTWIHYAALKIGRGEYFEVLDFISFLRSTVLSPLLQIKNGQLPRGLRRVEFNFKKSDLSKLMDTVPTYEPLSIFHSLEKVISGYQELREKIFNESIIRNSIAEQKVLHFLQEVKSKKQL